MEQVKRVGDSSRENQDPHPPRGRRKKTRPRPQRPPEEEERRKRPAVVEVKNIRARESRHHRAHEHADHRHRMPRRPTREAAANESLRQPSPGIPDHGILEKSSVGISPFEKKQRRAICGAGEREEQRGPKSKPQRNPEQQWIDEIQLRLHRDRPERGIHPDLPTLENPILQHRSSCRVNPRIGKRSAHRDMQAPSTGHTKQHGGQIRGIDAEESPRRIGPPVGHFVFSRHGKMDAKTAQNKKQHHHRPHLGYRQGEPTQRPVEHGESRWIRLNGPKSDPQVDAGMIPRHPERRDAAKNINGGQFQFFTTIPKLSLKSRPRNPLGHRNRFILEIRPVFV